MPIDVAVGLVGTAILSAIATGVTKATGTILQDVYKDLRTAIRNKYGADSGLYKAIRGVEQDPRDPNRITQLKAEIQRSKAGKDSTILDAAERVVDQVSALPEGPEILQIVEDGGMIVYGDYRVTAGRDVHINNSRVFYPPPPPPPPTDPMNLPKSMVGWVIVLPALACTLVGFLLFFMELTTDNPSEDQLNFAFRLVAVGIIAGIFGGIVDRIVSRNRRD